MKNCYVKSNIFPIFIEFLFVFSCFFVKKEYFVYTNFLFYLTLITYFFIKKDFSIKDWITNICSGKMFWKQVLYTALFFVGSFILAAIIENIFVDINSGMIVLRVNNLLELLLFSLSTIIFSAIVEETFFRKNLICFANKKILVTTTLSSMLLYSLEHALTISGILLCMIWALPLSLSYIKTKNIYVPMTAHFICNFIMNGFSVIIALQSGII